MTQMESPKRKMQKKNDYQRHKLFRKIKRRRKAQAEAEQQIAEKQLRKKLKLPKFGNGKIWEVYTSDIHFNNDDTAGGIDRYGNKFDYVALPEIVVTARKIPTFKDIEKQIGRKITQDEIDKVIPVDPEVPIEVPQPIEKGMYSPSITNELINIIAGTVGEAVNYLANKAGLPNIAPNEQLVETRDGDALFDLLGFGKAAKLILRGIGRYGRKLGLNKLQGLARQKLLKKEFALSNADKQLVKDIAYSKPRYDNELIISPSKKQKRLQLSQPTHQVYTGDKHKISEVIDDSGNVNLANILKQNSNQNGLSNGKILSDKIKEGYFNYTKGQEIPLNFDGNYFRVTKNMPQVMSEGDTGFKNFPVGEYYSENIGDYYKNVMQPLFNKQGIDPEMRLPRGIITVPENNVEWKGYFDKYSGIPYIKAKAVNGNLIDAIRSGQFNSTYLHEAASHGTDFKIPSSLKEQYRFENFLPNDYKWMPSVKDSKDWEEYRATMNQVRHKLLDTEHLINGKYPSGKELEKAIDNRQMDLIMTNFDVANGYGSDYYNAYKDLLDKAKQTNSYRDWQNIIDFENHIRNSLKYLPAVTPFAIGAKSNDYNSGKDIHIKPSKRGTFTKAAKQRGMSVQGFANRVLRNPSKYSAAMRKKANFARNASKWNK